MSYIFRSQGKKQLAMDAHSEVEHILSNENDPNLVHARINLARSYLEMGELDLGRGALGAFDATQSKGDELRILVLEQYWVGIMLNGDTDLALNHYLETYRHLVMRKILKSKLS